VGRRDPPRLAHRPADVRRRDRGLRQLRAISGQGIALAWSNLVDNHLQTGALVRPIDTVLQSDAQFCLLEPLGRGVMRQSVKCFRAWLLEQLPPALDDATLAVDA
jgi:hypothetical protein